MITIDFRKQQALDADPKAIQQTNFVGDLDRDENVAMYFIVEEAKRKEKSNILHFSQGTVELIERYRRNEELFH